MILYKKSRILRNIKRSNDNRGSILSIVDHKVLNVSIIELQNIQFVQIITIEVCFMYVLEGEIDYFYKSLGMKVKYLKVSIKYNFYSNLEIHATYFCKHKISS